MDVSHIAAIDHHAHNLLTPEAAARRPWAAAFTEGAGPEIIQRFAPQTLFYRRSLRDLADLLKCDPTEAAILARRAELGLEKLTETCFAAAHLDAIFLDDGFLPGEILPVSWHSRFVPARRVLRLESVAETLFAEANSFDDFRARYRAALDPPPPEVIAFKSIAAYRGGLDLLNPSSTVGWMSSACADQHFQLLQTEARQGQLRLTNPDVICFLFHEALEIAGRRGIPIQLHTGFGDTDLDLARVNPLLLRPLLEVPSCRSVPILLLHASYPYAREAGYLASVYPQVYVDCGLAVPFLSVSGMRAALRQLLELAPTGKVLYSSDAHLIPELFFLGARWGRAVLEDVLEGAVEDNDLTYREAEEVAETVLHDNARTLYRLG